MRPLRALFGGSFFLALMALVFWLVYSNDELVSLRLVGLWGGGGVPLPFGWSGLPQGLWYVLFTLLGLGSGLVLGWFFAGGTRRQAAQQTRRARQSERALASSRDQIDQAKSQIDSLQDTLKQRSQEPSKSLALVPTDEART